MPTLGEICLNTHLDAFKLKTKLCVVSEARTELLRLTTRLLVLPEKVKLLSGLRVWRVWILCIFAVGLGRDGADAH
jgi:hypothetical protein